MQNRLLAIALSMRHKRALCWQRDATSAAVNPRKAGSLPRETRLACPDSEGGLTVHDCPRRVLSGRQLGACPLAVPRRSGGGAGSGGSRALAGSANTYSQGASGPRTGAPPAARMFTFSLSDTTKCQTVLNVRGTDEKGCDDLEECCGQVRGGSAGV